jgi:hypothetical protein
LRLSADRDEKGGSVSDFLTPWPDDPVCPNCQKAISTFGLVRSGQRVVVRHADGSVPCELDCLPAEKRPLLVSLPMRTLPEFDALTGARSWARFVLEQDPSRAAIRLGYVRAHDGSRKIGFVEVEQSALLVVERRHDGTIETRPGRHQ